MPRLSDSMEEGTIVAWLKQVGDKVAVGQPLAEIETDKATMAYESDVAGTLLEIVVAEGEAAPVGAPIARIGDPRAPLAAISATYDGRPADQGSTRAKASPLARRMARETGIDLTTLTGSGPAGRIVKKDIEAARAAGTAPPDRLLEPAMPATETAKGTTTTVDLTRLQQTVARRMSEAKATTPHFYLQADFDVSALVATRARLKASARAAADGDPVPSVNDFVVKACALALRENPLANGSYRDGRLALHSRVNVGIAVAAAEALLVPTIFDADRLGVDAIAAEARRLAARARKGSITPPELAGGTFTVSNLGMYGVRNFAAVVNPPQAAILAVGAVAEQPVVRDGELRAAHLLGVTLSCDHRILHGAPAAELLGRIGELLEEPLRLAL